MEIIIGGNFYRLDISEMSLKSIDKPEKEIKLADITPDADGDFYLSHHNGTSELYAVTGLNSDSESLVRLPKALLTMDVTDQAQIDTINAESFKQDMGFVIINDTIQSRLSGKLPVVDLAGDKFFLDVRLNELRHIDDFSHRIDMDAFYSFDESICAIYDTADKQVLQIDGDTITETPKNAVYVELQDFFYIDPVGYARKDRLPDTYFLNNVLMVNKPAALVKPLSETELPSLIKKNRQQKGLPAEEINRDIHKKRKGKRL